MHNLCSWSISIRDFMIVEETIAADSGGVGANRESSSSSLLEGLHASVHQFFDLTFDYFLS